MELVVAIAVLAIITMAVTLVGLPFVDLIARFRPTRTQRAPSDVVQQQAVAVAAAFQPLQMEDSGQRWPSEVPRRKTAMDLLPWPSQTWADNPFPASQATVPEQQAARVARKAAPQPTRAEVQRTAAKTKAPRTSPKGPRTTPKAPRTGASKPRKQAQPKPTRQRAPTSGVSRRNAPPPTRPAQPTPQPPAVDVSTQAVLAIANDPGRGLAAAVEYVREQTGWSFQRAAQHVAMALRNHN